jgi:hypothetical protein
MKENYENLLLANLLRMSKVSSVIRKKNRKKLETLERITLGWLKIKDKV